VNDRAGCERPAAKDTLISVVLPVYNEGRVLPQLLDRLVAALVAFDGDYEIIFVDDGSCDDGPQVLDYLAARNSRIKVIHLSRNFGHQPAIQAGLVHCRGDAVVLMDSDMQDSPEAIAQFVRQWRLGFDVVYAIRRRRKEGPLKRLMFAAFHRLMSRVAAVEIPADAGNFGLVDRRVAAQIASLCERDRYFPGLRSWVGFRQKGIEIERNARYDDNPRVSLRGLIRLAKTAIFSFSVFPLLIFHVIGAMATAIFAYLSCFVLYCKLFTNSAIPGWASYVMIGSFFGALNALGICILGEYVIRIYDQVRSRPMYIIDRSVNLSSDAATGRHRPTGDEPYVELMQQAVRLLEAGTIREDSKLPAENPAEPYEPIAFPVINGED